MGVVFLSLLCFVLVVFILELFVFHVTSGLDTMMSGIKTCFQILMNGGDRVNSIFFANLEQLERDGGFRKVKSLRHFCCYYYYS